MKAVEFNLTIPRYALGLTLGKLFPTFLWNGLSCTALQEIPEPELLGPDWVKIQTRYGGICGSDIGTVFLDSSPYYTPFSSFPFVFGHENAGQIAALGTEVAGWQVGDRVVVEPMLWCAPRGFTELCTFCSRGEINRCERLRDGIIEPGIMTGLCASTGGSWSPYFLAHKSQLYRVPDGVSDENAVLVEPFAVGMHAVLQNWPQDSDTVIVQGCGTIGLMVIASLRALGSQARIIALARYPFQGEAARRLGADDVLVGGKKGKYAETARLVGATLARPLVGKKVVFGGAEVVYECAGTDAALDDALRFTRNGGRTVLVGAPNIAKRIDWTSIFSKELTVRASYVFHHVEEYKGVTWKTMDLALHLMESGIVDLGWMITHRYRVEDAHQALRDHTRRKSIGLIKGVFDF
jgi:threonine dehydrogenase-like Zn-dependent dehydrogenase